MIARTPGKDYVWPRRMPARNEQIGEYLLARRSLTRGEGYIQTSTLFVRRAVMQEQPFKSGQLKHQDTEWVLRMGRLPGAEVVFADEVLAIHNIEEDRPSVSSKGNWRYSLEWLQRDRNLFTPRALTGFVLYQIACEASDQGAWRAFHLLLLEVFRHGKSTPRDYAIFLAMWLLPRRRRLRFALWCTCYEDPSVNQAVSSCRGRRGERRGRLEWCAAAERAHGAGGDITLAFFHRGHGARGVD